MRYLFIAFLFISSFLSGQGIEPTSFQPTQYQGGILRGVIPYVDEFTGETLYIYQHVDSLVFIKDSIYVRNDSIFLRDGTGFAIVTDSIYVVTGVSKDTIKLRDGEGYVLMTKGNITKVTGTSPIIITDTISTPNVTIQNASTSQTGALTSTDWNTFNDIPKPSFQTDWNTHYFTNKFKSIFSNVNSPNGLFASGFWTSHRDNTDYGVQLAITGNASYVPKLYFRSRDNGNWQTWTKAVTLTGNTEFYFPKVHSDGELILGTTYENGLWWQTGRPVQIDNAYPYIKMFKSGDQIFMFGDEQSIWGTNPKSVSLFVYGNNSFNVSTNSGRRFYIGGDGLVGIGTTSPAKLLDINGELRIRDLTNDTPTKILGADNDGDVSSVTVGNGLTIDGGSLTVTANISGTQNRVAKFTSQYAVGNSEIYTVGDTLVGINQSNPQFHLDVSGKFRVTSRSGTAVTGAGFTSDGQLIAYNLDTALATPNTYLDSGTDINITGTGTMADPYTINNSAPENTTVKNSVHIDFSELSNDTITGTIIAGSIGSTELASTSVSAGSYTLASITVDQDGRITSAANGSLGITSIATSSPITGGTITSSGTIGINNAAADGSTKGAATFTAGDFNDNGSGLISLDYTNGQAASSITKGFLTSTDWTTFNNKEPAISLGTADQYWRGDKTWQNFNTSARNAISLTTTGSSGASTYNSSTGVLNVPNYTLSGLGGMDKWGYVAPSGSGGNVIAYVLDDQVINYYNGNGITIGRASGTHDVTITNTKPFDFLGVQANSGATGTLSNFGTLNLIGAGGTTVSRSGSNFTISSSSGSGTVTNVSATAGNGISTSVTNPTTTPNITVTNTKPFDYIGLQANSGSIYSLPNTWVLNLTGAGGTTVTRSNNSFTISSASTDNQTLSWSSPNLSISGGNSVTLPVLPSGSVNNTLRHDGSGWSATSLLSTTTSRVDVNSWPSTVNLGSKLLVNGGIQYNQSGFAATEISGRDAQGGLTGVSVGSGLTLSSGTLSATPIYAEVSYIGPSSTIGSWTSISFNQTAISNGMSTSSSGITIPSNGNYKIEYSVWGAFGNNTLTGYSGMQTRVFSGGVKGTRTERVYHSNTQPMDLSISHSCIFASLTAGNLVNLDVQQFSNSGAALTISAANLIVTKL